MLQLINHVFSNCHYSMRIPTAVYLAKKARTPQSEATVPFQEILPLRLKNTVSGKADSGSGKHIPN